MVKLHESQKASSALRPNMEMSQFGTNSETRPKMINDSRFNSSRAGTFSQVGDSENYQEGGVRSHHKKFNNREDKDKYIESYKKKKKTELCKNYERTGKCKFGRDCAFAHGEHELVIKNHVPGNYKTKMCKQFHEEGYCSYGNRCQFLHLVIQKNTDKFNFSDMLKESIFQFENRSKALNTDNMKDLMLNPVKKSRLSVFQELCSDRAPEGNGTNRLVNDSLELQFTYLTQDTEA